MSHRRYALVGAGHRSQMYVDAITGPYADRAALVAICEPNPVRAQYYVDRVVARGLPAPAVYGPDDLEEMIRDRAGRPRHRVPRATTCTPQLIVRSLDAGADVVVEKPLTIDGAVGGRHRGRDRAHRPRGRHHLQLPLLAAQQRAAAGDPGRHDRRGDLGRLLVGARHQARRGLLPPLAPREGALRRPARAQGEPPLRPRQLVDPLEPAPRLRVGRPALLRRRERGGPRHPEPSRARHARRRRRVRARPARRRAARGALPRRRAARRLPARPRRVLATASRSRTTSPSSSTTPRARRSATRSTPTRRGRATASRSTAPLGRAELEVVERGAVLADEGLHPVLDPSAVDAGTAGLAAPRGRAPHRAAALGGAPTRCRSTNGDGGHGGGDALLLADVFEGPGDDPLGRPADWRDGVRSIAVGIAGNRSLETGLPVRGRRARHPLPRSGRAARPRHEPHRRHRRRRPPRSQPRRRARAAPGTSSSRSTARSPTPPSSPASRRSRWI